MNGYFRADTEFFLRKVYYINLYLGDKVFLRNKKYSSPAVRLAELEAGEE